MERFPAPDLRTLVLISVAAGLAGCVVPSEPVADIGPAERDGVHAPGDVGAVSGALIGSRGSDATEDATVKIFTAGSTVGAMVCTGVLVAPTLVLTARHCVTSGILNSSITQCVLGSDLIPVETFRVQVGPQLATTREFRVKRAVIDYNSDRCVDDVAAMELTEPVTGVTFPPIELDVPPNVGDSVRSVGWGAIEDDPQVFPDERQRMDGRILGVTGGTYQTAAGSAVSAPANIIVSSTVPCFGDSGSPLFDARGAVLGTLFGGLYPSTSAEYCDDGLGMYIPFHLHAKFVERLFQSIGKMPPRAGRPLPAELGGVCAQNDDCNSNYCVGVGARAMCSKSCTIDTDCGGAFVCSDTGGGASVCLDQVSPPARDESCTIGLRPSARPGERGRVGGIVAGAVVVAIGALARRRRRHASASS